MSMIIFERFKFMLKQRTCVCIFFVACIYSSCLSYSVLPKRECSLQWISNAAFPYGKFELRDCGREKRLLPSLMVPQQYQVGDVYSRIRLLYFLLRANARMWLFWIRSNEFRSYSYDFETLLTPVGSFVGVKFLIVATSAVENFVHRDIIRRTWGAELRAEFDSKLVFLLGTTSNRWEHPPLLRKRERERGSHSRNVCRDS